LVRFAKKHRIPLIEMSRGVYRLTVATIHQLQEAAQCRSASISARTPGRSGFWAPSSLRVQRQDAVLGSVLELTTRQRRGKKPPRSKPEFSGTSTTVRSRQRTASSKLVSHT
jgi:hypothetical protein